MSFLLQQTYLQTPDQAAEIFTQNGGFPKQKHAFLVRFIQNANTAHDANPTYAVKTCDRPSFTLETQQLNQYNKKRVVYTGYKTNPLKVSFYDSADQSAQTLWMNYSTYYFGDFAQAYTAFNDDIITASSNWIANLGTKGFGFTAANGGQSEFGTQYLIKYIEILQFNGGTYDTYTLVNPKISTFEMDELDYSAADVSTITMTFEFEAVIFSPGTEGAAAASVEEFQQGSGFYGDPLDVPGIVADLETEYYLANATSSTSITSDILTGLFAVAAATTTAPNYNYYNGGTGSGLNAFGAFTFGALAGAAVTSSSPSTLASSAITNVALAAALNLSSPNSSYNSTGIPSDTYNQANAVASRSTSNALASSIVSNAILVDTLAGNSNSGINSTAGLILSASAYGAINAQRSGTSQYGYNAQTTPYGNSYGSQGSSGYTSPADYGSQPFGMFVEP